MKYVLLTSLLSLALHSGIVPYAIAEGRTGGDSHGHKQKQSRGSEDAGSEGEHAHSEDSAQGHGNEKEGSAEEEGGARVGPDKGVLEVSEALGIKLAPEAEKTFDIKTLKLSGGGAWAIPLSARLLSGEEENLFRLRGGYFKRIDFRRVNSAANSLVVTSNDLRDGDEIVVSGLGFLRVAEIAASGGAPEGHSH